MRIGLVRRGYSASGGAERYLRGFAMAAMAAGHEIVLFCSPEWPADEIALRQTVSGRSPAAFSKALEALQPRKHCDRLFSLERVSSCDIFRAGDGVHAAWLQRRARFESGLQSFSHQINPKHISLKRLERLAMNSAQIIIANSAMVREEIAEHYGPATAARVSVVHNGIDPVPWQTPATSREEIRARWQIAPDQRVVAFVGSGWERKGLRFAVQAVRLLPNTLLLVAGKGKADPFRAAHVRFLGTDAPVADVFHAADAFVLPTIYDPFSNATLEALASGLPVITTRANGCAEILDPGVDGTAVDEADDIAAIQAALTRWLAGTPGATRRNDVERTARMHHAAALTQERNFQETLRIIAS